MIQEHFQELLKYRALIWALVQRHLAARYRGSFLGMLWSFLNPLCLMAVYTLVFQYYIRFTEVENYTIFLFCGLLPWIWVSSALVEGSISISTSGSLITKSMFPAHLLPVVFVLNTGVHFLLSLPLLFLFMLIGGEAIQWTVLFVPLLILLQFFFLHGLVLCLAALNVYFRDVQHLVGNVLTLLFFLCPILYPTTIVPEAFKFSLIINPFAVFTVCYQKLILDGLMPSALEWIMLFGWSSLSVYIGVATFYAYRESFAEVL